MGCLPSAAKKPSAKAPYGGEYKERIPVRIVGPVLLDWDADPSLSREIYRVTKLYLEANKVPVVHSRDHSVVTVRRLPKNTPPVDLAATIRLRDYENKTLTVVLPEELGLKHAKELDLANAHPSVLCLWFDIEKEPDAAAKFIAIVIMKLIDQQYRQKHGDVLLK